MITATEDGAVKLYYDHNLRLETQTSRTLFRGSGGIGVYGDSGSNQNGQIVYTLQEVQSMLICIFIMQW